MFYDLEDPVGFARQVGSVLDPQEGVWVFEQSYMPLMLARNSYDTICHEHLEYYGLKQIAWITARAGLKVIDVETNDVNGGSFSVVAVPASSPRVPTPAVAAMLAAEEAAGLGGLTPYLAFSERTRRSRETLRAFVAQARREGKRVCALGASTKGNVVLQYCGFTPADIESVGEVNPDKFGACTPGTWLPIREEGEVLASAPDYLLVLPWHFRPFFLSNPRLKGHRLVFPLPELDVVIPS
jgi:NDP-4-keto-2,6-dideoxyhexose 3-C-methyltransferase